MGEFTIEPQEKPERVSRHHQRIFNAEVTALITDVPLIADAVHGRELMSGYVIRHIKDTAVIHMSYGPVHGGWKSDIAKLLRKLDIDYDITELDPEHVPDGCRHEDCIA